ncbi:MAG: hypothetical protein JWP09_369 [Candidatus Taylorbacteria bacterium]|nr:hypothetical protein [Candidatus Taylorbacteria bacterium]
MDIHIDKKIAGLMIGSLLVGGVLGGGIGFAAGHDGERGHGGERGGYEMNGQDRGGVSDNQADGEIKDDNGGAPNQDEKDNSASSTITKVLAPATK